MASFLDARVHEGSWHLRIEDLDSARAAPGASDAILRTLETFGFEWDGPVLYQNARAHHYARAFEKLEAQGLVFGCVCSRREIADSAATGGHRATVYPGTCRAGIPSGRAPRAWRLRVEGRAIEFVDRQLGEVRQDLVRDVGDFILKRADGPWAYQLAVVVDDAATGVTDIVRGADLLDSTARQIYLYGCLGWRPPRYLHVPIVTHPSGEKLSKQTGARALDQEQPRKALHQAARHLGLDPLADSNIREFWSGALAAWEKRIWAAALDGRSGSL